MQSNDYGGYDAYNDYAGANHLDDDSGHALAPLAESMRSTGTGVETNWDDPKTKSLPKILLMGPRRGGKTSIQVSRLLLRTTS